MGPLLILWKTEVAFPSGQHRQPGAFHYPAQGAAQPDLSVLLRRRAAGNGFARTGQGENPVLPGQSHGSHSLALANQPDPSRAAKAAGGRKGNGTRRGTVRNQAAVASLSEQKTPPRNETGFLFYGRSGTGRSLYRFLPTIYPLHQAEKIPPPTVLITVHHFRYNIPINQAAERSR